MKIRTMAPALLVIWPIGGIVGYGWLLARCRRAILSRKPSRLSRACALLHRDFEPQYYFFELAIMVERIALCGVLLLIPQKHNMLRLFLAVLMTTVGAVVIPLIRPYKKLVHNYLSISSHVGLQMIFLGALLVKLHDDFTEYASTEVAFLVLSFRSSDHILTLMFGFCVLVIALLILMFAAQLRAARHMPALHFGDGHRPELSLGDTFAWHLFISHTWSTGQVRLCSRGQ